MHVPIIFIGPMCSGKSTLALLVAEHLNIPRYELDELRWQYYDEHGYDAKQASRIVEQEGMLGIIRYWKPFEAYAVERVLAEYQDGVIDFGAGHSIYDDDRLFNRVQQALAPYPHVILVLPSPDPDQSIAILNDRLTALLKREVGSVDPAILHLNAEFVRHRSNHQLAKHVLYTDGKTPEETYRELLTLIG